MAVTTKLSIWTDCYESPEEKWLIDQRCQQRFHGRGDNWVRLQGKWVQQAEKTRRAFQKRDRRVQRKVEVSQGETVINGLCAGQPRSAYYLVFYVPGTPRAHGKWEGWLGLTLWRGQIGNFTFVPESNAKPPMRFPSWTVIFIEKKNKVWTEAYKSKMHSSIIYSCAHETLTQSKMRSFLSPLSSLLQHPQR